MTRAVVAAVVLVLVLVSSVSAGAGTAQEHIVFAATNAPLNDDVMFVGADGTELDLSNSPALDTAPVLSPNGRLVAFFSMRNGHGAEYVVGIDGKGLRPVTPHISWMPSVAWAPDSRELAVVDAGLFRTNLDGGWTRLDHGGVAAANQLIGWSPDGKRIAYVDSLEDVRVVARDGRVQHVFDGLTGKWSPTGRLAVDRDNTIWQVFDMSGRRLSTISSPAGVAWSANGQLASITAGGALQIRRGGAGRPILTARPVRGASDPRWLDANHVLVEGADGNVIYDVSHRATFLAPAAYRIDPAIARDGSAYGEYPFGTLVRSTLSGSTRTLVKVPYCQGRDTDAFESLQAAPDGSGAIFAGDCEAPNDLYSIAPDGSGLTRLTSTPQDELDPAVSPDGTRLAFSRVDSAGCDGCDHQIWTSAFDGSDARAVSLPAETQDDNPSFSPDGARLLFERWEPAVTGDGARLAEAPAAGGNATMLKIPGGYPAWGPTRIAFDSAGKLVTARPDGSGAQTVAKGDWIPAWSSAGRLALIHWGAPLSILLPATGTQLALPGLHDAVGEPPGLAWSPDGTRLAFTAADRDGVADVWTIGADGTGLTRVTRGLGAAGGLAWR